MKRFIFAALVGLSPWMAGCATAPCDPAARAAFRANHDPLEPLNRKVFAFNLCFDRWVIKPLAKGYKHALPSEVRTALRHFLDNLDEPVVLANCLLQGRFKSAGETAGRLVINSTVGVAGLNDVATGWKLPKQIGDFGQTLWADGVGEGPYLIIPVFGPTNPRDGIGEGLIDTFFDPLRYLLRHRACSSAVSGGRIVFHGLDERAESLDSLDEIQRESIDYYAAFRSLYRQNRAAELRKGTASTALPSIDFYSDPGE